MTLDPDTFRSVLGRFASGITIVTARDADLVDHGMTVSAFCSASLQPPLVLACIDRDASMLPVIEAVPHFGVSILSAGQEQISRRFAGTDLDRFDGIGYARGQHGVALLDDALAHLECRIVDRHWAGDHLVILGEVEAAVTFAERPLLYYRGGYAHLER
jgi:flavin reductase (DIM6/NTAB) family NADH-FMN oxidoreductase RutF